MIREGDFDAVLRRARSGDETALGELYELLAARVVGFLRAYVGRDCEDVASEVWLSVARSLGSFSGGESDFRCWVFTIARRRAADWWRAAPPVTVVGLDVVGADVVDERPGGSEAWVEDLAAHEMFGRLAEALPEDQSKVVLLRVVGGLTTDEVARVLGKRPGTVRMLLHRALRRLAPLADELFENSAGEV